MNILGLIPARGGKQAVKNKNVLPVAGRPLIAHTLEAARQSRLLTRVAVSTEDPSISEVSRRLDVEVIPRPPEFAREDSPIQEALLHAVDYLQEKEGYRVDVLVWLQANVPIRKPGMIDQVVQRLVESPTADSVVSVFEVDQFPQWMKKMGTDGFLAPNIPGVTQFRRQELSPLYLIDGAIVAIRGETLLRTRGCEGIHCYMGDRVLGVAQEHQYSIEIDSADDFLFAESMMSVMRQSRVGG